MHRRSSNERDGFTLVEVLVVIVITVILSSLVFPNYVRMANRARLNGATRELVGDLMKVRMQCVSESRQYKFAFGGATYKIYRDENRNGTFEGDELYLVRDVYGTYAGVRMSAPKEITFNPRGTVTGTTVTVNNGTDTKKVMVNIAGRVKVES